MNYVLKPIKTISLMLFFEIIILFVFFTSKYSIYSKNIFSVELSGVPMSCFYSEKYKKIFLINAGSSGYNDIKNRVNRIDLNDNLNLKVIEYEVHYKNGDRKKNIDSWNMSSERYNYNIVNTSKLKLKIKRMNKILYDGEFISDLSNIINESGRYYFHIYAYRNEDFLTSVKTHISFNVIVSGGNNETKNYVTFS